MVFILQQMNCNGKAPTGIARAPLRWNPARFPEQVRELRGDIA